MEASNWPAMMKTIAVVLTLASAWVVLGTWQSAEHTSSAAVELESAILPPYKFRQWVDSVTSEYKNDPHLDVPMDRFAGRGDHSVPTRMPSTREQMELLEARKNMAETTKAFEPMLQNVEGLLLKDPKNETLLAQKEELEGIIRKAHESLVDMQEKVNDKNKDLVQGRARWANQPGFLGGSDHFVPLNQAQQQLAGGGYGHSYSITDWLAGD